MNGKLEGCKHDSIVFKFHETKLKFKNSDIISIFFDEKLAPSDLTKTTKSNEIQLTTQGGISGVITYYFNKNYGDKPDVGAKIYIADSLKVTDFNIEVVDSFHYASFYKSRYSTYKALGKVPDDIAKQVEKYSLDDKLAYDSLDKRAAISLFKIEYAKDVVKTVVDGNGNYSVKLKPSTYYVYVTSNNRTGLSITEGSGKVKCEKVIVKNGVDANMSCNFSIYWRFY